VLQTTEHILHYFYTLWHHCDILQGKAKQLLSTMGQAGNWSANFW